MNTRLGSKTKKMKAFAFSYWKALLGYWLIQLNRFIYPLLKSSVLIEAAPSFVIECLLETKFSTAILSFKKNCGIVWLQKGSETHNLVVIQITFSSLLSSGICIPTTKRPWWRWMDHLLSTSLKIQYLMQTWGRVSSSVWALTPRQRCRSQLCSGYSGYSGFSQ